MNQELNKELIALAEEDQSLLQSVKESGELEDESYHPELKRLHERNTERAKEILEDSIVQVLGNYPVEGNIRS